MGWTLGLWASARRTAVTMTLLASAWLGSESGIHTAQAGEAASGSHTSGLPIDPATCQVIPGMQGPRT